MDGTAPLVSIITINYNAHEATLDLLHSLEKQTYRPVEIIVVDNGSSNFPAARFKTEFPEVQFVLSKKNLGFAGGNNLGVQRSKGDYLFFVNNDTEVTVELIRNLVDTFKTQPNLGALSPKILYFPTSGTKNDIIQYAGTTSVHPLTGRNQTIGEGEQDSEKYRSFVKTAYTHGAAMMVPRALIKEVGLMPEDFFLYYEELDWCEKIRKKGYEIGVQLNATIYHKESLTTGKASPLKTYYLTRNRILFMRRNFDSFSLLAFTLFFTFTSVPANFLSYLITGDWKLMNAFFRGISWHFQHKAPKRLPTLTQILSTKEKS